MRRKRSEASGPLVNPIRSQLAQSALNAGQYFPPSIAKVERCRKQNIPYNIVMIVWDQLSGREAREGTTRRTEESDGLFCAMQKLDTPSVRAPTHTHTHTHAHREPQLPMRVSMCEQQGTCVNGAKSCVNSKY